MIEINTTAGMVPMYEMYDSFRKGIDLQAGPYVEQDYVLRAEDWDKTDATINFLMGSTSVVGGIGGAIIRVPGFPCPTSPNLSCIDAVCIGRGERCLYDGGHVEFNLPIIRTRYGRRTWAQNAGDDPGGLNSFVGANYTYAEMSIEYSSETLKVPNSAYQFTSPTLPASEVTAINIGTATMRFTRKRVPFLPAQLLLQSLCAVNNDVFFGMPAGTILYLGAQTVAEYESDGSLVQDISLNFKYRQFEWNMFPRPDTGVFDYIRRKSDGALFYEAIDLTPLLFS